MRWVKEYRRDAFTMKTGCLPRGLVIHRYIGYPPDVWFLSAYDIGITQRQLVSVAAEDAQDEALSLVREFLSTALGQLGQPIDVIPEDGE